MSNPHKSLFLKAKEYKGNPLSEYNKICSFLNKECYYSNSIYSLISSRFQCSSLLRGNYIDFEDCLHQIISNLETYKESSFEFLDETIQETLLDDFLLFCEAVSHIYFVAYNSHVKGIWNNSNFDKNIYLQLFEIIKTSLKSMNHDIKLVDEETNEFVAIKCNVDAELVAGQSPVDLKTAIIYYLGCRESDIEEKENKLHKIIDLLEPLFKKYRDFEAVKKIEEYVQLLRHPEVKKDERQYKWFFNDKREYIDSIFMMCIFVKEYDITKKTIKSFEGLKKDYNT